MEVTRKVYRNNFYEGNYRLFKWRDEYWWGYIFFSPVIDQQKDKILIIKKDRFIDTYIDIEGYDYIFKFEEGDI